jgi:hypothetical protein
MTPELAALLRDVIAHLKAPGGQLQRANLIRRAEELLEKEAPPEDERD